MKTCTLPVDRNTLDSLTFYQENLTPIYHLIHTQVKNREVAEDLTSQVFLKAVRYLNDQCNDQNMRSWLLQAAHATVIDYWRAIKCASTLHSSDALLETADWKIPNNNKDAPGININQAERVQHILRQLPERYREVLTYRFLLKLTVSETAQLMGVSETTVKTFQFRALHSAATLDPL